MNATTYSVEPQQSAAAQIDLMPFVEALIWSKWILLAGMLAGATLTAWLAINTPYSYVSGAKVSVVDIEDPGGVSPDDRRASEVLTLVEHGFVMGTTRDNYNEVMMARLHSRTFTQHFLDTHNIYRYFYPKMWDAEQQRWKGDFTSDRGAIFTTFRDDIRMITVDEETDIVNIAMRWPDPTVPADWANLYVQTFNEYMRNRTQQDVERKVAFLEEKLRQSDVVEIQKSIYRLIEAQTAIQMLANARDEYVLEVIDPAARPYRSVNMARKKKVAVGSVVGLLLTTFAVLGVSLLLQLWNAFQAARKASLANKQIEASQ